VATTAAFGTGEAVAMVKSLTILNINNSNLCFCKRFMCVAFDVMNKAIIFKANYLTITLG